MPLEAGTKVGRYSIVRLLAQGGMAEVYRAEQELTSGISRPAAVKVIRPEYSESEDFRGMFLDEARTACTLSHPNIVHIYEVGETDDNLLYMAMELVPGESLATVARTLRQYDERLSNEALFAVGILCCSALEAVHALRVEGGTVNLVHRDVSPHNLLLSAQGGLKLIDFGISKAATNRNLTMPGVTKGKAGYFSPEQAMGKKLDGRSDLFSLGVTLYKLASGATPFDDHQNQGQRQAALVRGQWTNLEEFFPGLPEGFYDVVDRALQLKPEDRFPTALEMREALEKAAFDSGLRVGQSSLMGYLTPDGQITANGGARAPATATQGSLPRVPSKPQVAKAEVAEITDPVRATPYPIKPRAKTAPVTRAAQAPARRGLVLVVAFVAAVAIGIFGMLLLVGGPPKVATVDAGAPLVIVTPPTPTPVVVPTPPPTPPVVEEDAGPVEVAVVVETPPVKPVVRPVKPLKALVPVATKVETPTAPPAVEIPAGEGKLRINATDAASVASVLVGGDDWGAVPVNKTVPSGMYSVVLKFTDGHKSPAWRGAVMPDTTKALNFDVKEQRWR